MPEPRVRFIDVSKTYDGQDRVVDRLNLDVADGEFVTLLGPSGSGKTTTLMMLAGFEHPSSGEILVDGNRMNTVPPYLRDIGVVFQNYALFPHMTVAENVAFPLKVRGRLGRAEIEARVRRVLDLTGLGRHLDSRPRTLSGGQQQRVALARAMVFEPRLILMDEPLGALDLKLRQKLQLEIKHLHRSTGTTILYVTHDQNEALTLSDRVAVFHDGRVQQVADPRTLYEQPANRFVADFIGENNILPGRLVRLEGGVAGIELEGGALLPATAAPGFALGTRVALCVRPEEVRILPGDAPGRMIEGTVQELIYRGDRIAVRMLVAGDDSFLATAPVPEVAALMPGSRVGLAWHRERGRAVREET